MKQFSGLWLRSNQEGDFLWDPNLTADSLGAIRYNLKAAVHKCNALSPPCRIEGRHPLAVP